ncbi:EamA family transporter [Rhodospirillum rubrum]|uniref:aromatic amino acid exporter YddG n=1 Tax=Rhodospirillum rubrum TaxID=1085 RepID=UPI00190732FB|nr:EamA family transporter [Rhodospirillum rubrum]MBK1664212.1 EamA family transporter [Rhodospirillum rubrum]MBK1676438.1 EamA family transporter [Rhodospirillum rubrum]
MSSSRATLIGSTAVLMWGTLALLTTWTGAVPPFQLTAMSFTIAFLLMAAKWLIRGERPAAHLRQPVAAWILGVFGLFGYHFFYFMALREAPPVEAGLIAYLWPLLIVLFSALLPGERLRWFHVVGALMGLAGTVLLVTRGGAIAFDPAHLVGHLAALVCAVTWATYSVLSRRFGTVPTDAVGWFCGATALLALPCHLIFETTRWPEGAGQWLAVLALGLGPVGAAFFTWDHGVKHGDIQVLGALSYGAPLISTALLIAFGKGEATALVGAACLLIVGGALLAGKSMLARSKRGG